MEQPATTIKQWQTQIAQAAITQISGVRLNQTKEGVEVVLDAKGQLPAPEFSIVGNAAIANIPNAALVTDVVDALGNVSGVSADSDQGVVTEFSIRGFNRAPVLLDGFRLFGDTTLQETANLERIEVLRGPASILFGEIQPGGFVNLVTERPTADPFYDIQLQVGSFGLIRPELDVSGPLTDDRRLLYRLNAVYNREDGFRDFDTDYERFFLSPVVTGVCVAIDLEVTLRCTVY